MPDYKLFRIDGAGNIAGPPEHFPAVDDAAALAQADERRRGGAAELWQGNRLVARIRA